MPDDARTRGIEAEAIERIVRALFDAGWVAPRTGSDDAPDAITTVWTALTGWAPPPATSSAAPEGAALQAYGSGAGSREQDTKTPPAPASDDVKARAIETARASWGNRLHWIAQDVIDRTVSDLAAAGLLAGPSHLDRLAAWVSEHRMHTLRVYRFGWDAMVVEVVPRHRTIVSEVDPDQQEAARRVLARLEATDE